MSILVTGSAGHLGEALMRSFRASRTAATGVDMIPSPFTDRVGSIRDRAFVDDVMKGARAVIHPATLHKPHVATHGKQDFIDTNITGTLNLLESAAAAGVEAFVFTSTTSAFGAALTPAPSAPAAWINEDVVPVPRNIYGVSKTAAEDLCALVHRQKGMPIVILRTSRFFPEVDDDPAIRGQYELANVQVNELLYRRVDIEDVVSAHLLALDKARQIGFGRYIVSATTPFEQGDLAALRAAAPSVVHRLFPDCQALFAARGWRVFPTIDRVYVNRRAREELGWRPKYDFGHALRCLSAGRDFASDLAREVGSKSYHPTHFEQGPYPVGET